MKKSYHSTRLPEQAPMMALTRFLLVNGPVVEAWSVELIVDADMMFTLFFKARRYEEHPGASATLLARWGSYA
ncbi:hypothetical protein D3C86_1984060 [compost metagenome]